MVLVLSRAKGLSIIPRKWGEEMSIFSTCGDMINDYDYFGGSTLV